jgi:hypothetical protein
LRAAERGSNRDHAVWAQLDGDCFPGSGPGPALPPRNDTEPPSVVRATSASAPSPSGGSPCAASARPWTSATSGRAIPEMGHSMGNSYAMASSF